MQLIRDWFQRSFSDPQVVGLAVLLVLGFAIVLVMGDMLAPVIASLIVAYLLEGLVGALERRRLPRLLAVLVVFSVFIAFMTAVFFGLLPLLSRQVTQLVQQLPFFISSGQEALERLPELQPNLFSQEQVTDLIAAIRSEVGALGQKVLSVSLASAVGVLALAVYTILVPILVFFFLKDKRRLIAWFARFLPREHGLAAQVWREVDLQIGNYIRGKFIEILIVASASYVAFSILDLQYSMLLSVLVGLSVLIPYVGAVAVTVPIALIAYFQWGPTSEFAYLLIAYAVIQALDGNVLVPLLFSEVVNLHPIAIIVAILVFGGLWGLWGVFFAIPLATLVQAVIGAWPRRPRQGAEPSAVSAASDEEETAERPRLEARR